MIVIGLLSLLASTSIGAASADPAADRLQSLLDSGKLLSARVFARQMAQAPRSVMQWYSVRTLLYSHPEIGSDIVLGWEKRGFAATSYTRPPNDVNTRLKEADRLLLANRFAEAVSAYQGVAKDLKPKLGEGSTPTRALYPFVLHGLARALFGQGRFAESLLVYTWLGPTYPRFRQAQFEKMWAAFKAGHIDLALGAVASQRSGYFSKYLEPESYLVLIYLYKILCRDADLKEVGAEIDAFKKAIASGTYDMKEWARSDLETATLYRVLESDPAKEASDTGMDRASLVREQQSVRSFLERWFELHKKRLSEQLKLIQAYSSLALAPGMNLGLKPLEKVPSREALFRAGLEIWPADPSEEWVDEVGSHRYIGESRCAAK